jgi:dTDP-4-amino-4,6-dideoxygalactose transaminase
VAEEVWFEQHVNLPIYPTLRPERVDTMVDAVARAVKRVRVP